MARQSTGGAIVNVGDWAVARPYLNYAAYFISKGSIGAMTRMLAVELAAQSPGAGQRGFARAGAVSRRHDRRRAAGGG